MLFQIAEDLFAIGVGDLGVDLGVLNVAVAQMVSHVFYAATGFQEVNSNRVAKGVNRAAGNPCLLTVGLEKMLHHPFLQRTLPPSKEVRAHIITDPEVPSQGFGRVAPEGLLSPHTVFEATDTDAVLLRLTSSIVSWVASSTRRP
jgi:hypothetical protein